MRRAAQISLAMTLHAALLVLPALVLGQPQALARPAMLVWILGALALQAVEGWTTRGRDDATHEPGRDLRLAALSGLLLLAIQWASAAEHVLGGGEPPLWLAVAGALVLALGIALRRAAICALGADFVSPNLGRLRGRLVRCGVYARLRHPSELGLLAFALGCCGLLGSAVGAALTLFVLAPLVVWRTRLEDRALLDRFPAYAAYSAAVGGLAPRGWGLGLSLAGSLGFLAVACTDSSRPAAPPPSGGWITQQPGAGLEPTIPAGLSWRSGDVHMHSESVSPTHSLTPAHLLDEMAREDLDVGCILVWGVRPEVTRAYFTGDDHTSTPRVLHYDLEVSGFGDQHVDHVVGLGLRDSNPPRAMISHPVYQWALDQGAVVGAAHASHWSATRASHPLRTSQVPADFPVCVALGQPLFLITEVLERPGNYVLWYGLLNCGFRVPLAGGSDWPVAGTRAGEHRTYVGVFGELTYSKWIEGIRAGRTVVTKGGNDLLELYVGGQTSGGEVSLPSGGASVRVLVKTRLAGSQAVEIVVNGAVVATHQVDTPGESVELEVSIEHSAWLAARSQRVHTGPVYLSCGGQPVRASAEDADYFAGYVDYLVDQVRAQPTGDEAQRQQAVTLYASARPVFERIAAEARAQSAR